MQGKGMMLWQIDSDRFKDDKITPKDIPYLVRDLGLQWLAIKMSDGRFPYNRNKVLGVYTDNDLWTVVNGLRMLGIEVVGWGFSYGGYWQKPAKDQPKPEVMKKNGMGWYPNGAAEGAQAAKRAMQFGVKSWLWDAEDHQSLWSACPNKHTQAAQFIKEFRKGAPGVALGINSYRSPDDHPEIPWNGILKTIGVDFAAPQVYWVGSSNSDQQLYNSLAQYRKFSSMPYIPIGPTYQDENTGWVPTVNQLQKFWEATLSRNLPGIGFWAIDEAGGPLERPEVFDFLKNHVWPGVPEGPSDEPEPEPVEVNWYDGLSLEKRVQVLCEAHKDLKPEEE